MRIAQAERAKTLVQHALACPHRKIVTCPNFRAALKAYRDSQERRGHAADETLVRRVTQQRRGHGARGGTGT